MNRTGWILMGAGALFLVAAPILWLSHAPESRPSAATEAARLAEPPPRPPAPVVVPAPKPSGMSETKPGIEPAKGIALVRAADAKPADDTKTVKLEAKVEPTAGTTPDPKVTPVSLEAKPEAKVDARAKVEKTPVKAPAPSTEKIVPGGNYTVQPGDSLPSIAKRAYGDSKRWYDVYIHNYERVADPNVLRPGWVLKIPK